MIKRYYNYATDMLLVYGFLIIIISSYILWFILPMGQGLGGIKYCERQLTGEGVQGNHVFIFEFSRYSWVDIHSWVSIVVITLLLIHLLFHCQWIIKTMKRMRNFIINRQKAILERYIAAYVLFILLAVEVLSGCIIWLIIPRGSGNLFSTQAGFGPTFWGIQRNVWVDIHAWIAVFMIAIIIVHVFFHWRWIVNLSIDRLQSYKVKRIVASREICRFDKQRNDSEKPNYIHRAGMLIGLIGAICFLVSMLTFQLDWSGRYDFMIFLIPIPFIILKLARKLPAICGIILILLGIATVLFYVVFPIGIVWNQIGVWNELGLETLYTIFFITLPFITAGFLFIASGRLKKLRLK